MYQEKSYKRRFVFVPIKRNREELNLVDIETFHSNSHEHSVMWELSHPVGISVPLQRKQGSSLCNNSLSRFKVIS